MCVTIEDLIGKTTFIKKYAFQEGKSAFLEIEGYRIMWYHLIRLMQSATMWKNVRKSSGSESSLCPAEKGGFSGKITYVRLTKVVFPGTTCSVITISLAVLSWLWCDHSLTYKKHSVLLRVSYFPVILSLKKVLFSDTIFMILSFRILFNNTKILFLFAFQALVSPVVRQITS